ncbi:hypothetical protein D3C78_840430 [compost metagenome]
MPESSGYRRASRNTPALTMVAECRYAETGVGAAMAWGSQKWNGNCADLVNTPSSTRHSATGNNALPCSRSRAASTSVSSKLPTVWPISRMPASSARPPPPVTASDMRAPLRASERWFQKPIRRNDDRLVSSQNTSISSRFSVSTTPSMEPMNSSRKAKKRPIGSLSER